MKKGILKKIGKYSLITSGAILFTSALAVMVGARSTIDKSLENKQNIIEEYKVSQEFEEKTDEQYNSYMNAFKSGDLSASNFTIKINGLSSDNFAEECILKGKDETKKIKLIDYNKQIEDSTKLALSQLATLGLGLSTLAAGNLMKDKQEEIENA